LLYILLNIPNQKAIHSHIDDIVRIVVVQSIWSKNNAPVKFYIGFLQRIRITKNLLQSLNN
jgi:hypothetical protein